MSKIEVNTVEPQCGTTLTLGASGDTVTLGSGASQSGFGRTGTVNWDTTAKTASFTGVSGNGYFVNTTSGVITVTLPASPSAGDIIGIKDYAGTFNTNNVTVGRNSSLINGVASDATLDSNGQSVFLVYVDGTKGWIPTQDDSSNLGSSFITATGGTITTCGDFRLHTFTGPGTFTVSSVGNNLGSNTVDYLVVAGGGGGGADHGGGGGAGGFRFYASPNITSPYPASPLNGPAALPVSAQAYPITVGAGGAGGAAPGPSCGLPGANGNNSVFSTITATAGGFGSQSENPSPSLNGGPGGSGGGGGSRSPGNEKGTAGAGNTPPVSPSQGQPGGTANTDDNTYRSGGGGGGALVAGTNAGPTQPTFGLGGDGGGFPVNHFGCNGELSCSVRYFAGGGGGGATASVNTPTPGSGVAGGLGGGGNGGTNPCSPNPAPATTGTANTGGGGGASGVNAAGVAGGSGIVVIRYKFQ